MRGGPLIGLVGGGRERGGGEGGNGGEGEWG